MENLIQVNPKQLKTLVTNVLEVRKVPMVWGPPGIGKSQIIEQIAEEFNLEVIMYILSNSDVTDIKGFPTLNADRTRSTIAPPDYFPLEGDDLPEGKAGWLIFCDELTDAESLLQASVNQLLQERRIGNKKLHPKAVVVAAGNRTTDGAAAQEMSNAAKSRLTHFELDVNYNDWNDWAQKADIFYPILGYLAFKPQDLYQFNQVHQSKCTLEDFDGLAYACPRSWESLSTILKGVDRITDDHMPLIAGTIGEGIGRGFKAFLDLTYTLPTIEEIIKNPEGISVGERPEILHAYSCLISHHINLKNADQLMKFITRLPKDFQFLTLRFSVKKDQELSDVSSVDKWCDDNHELFS